MKILKKDLNFFLLLGNFILSLILYADVLLFVPQGILQTIKLQQIFALTALIYLYGALLIQPLYVSFPKLPFRKMFYGLQPTLIIGTFYFGLIHAYISFFQQLGGFSGLSFLSNNYLFAISFSATALLILFVLSCISLLFLIKKIHSFHSKIIDRLLYIAGILTFIHAMLLGTHFQNLANWIPQIIFFAVAFLCILLAKQVDVYLSKKISFLPRFGISMIFVISCLFVLVIESFLPQNTLQPFNIHAQHIQLAKDAQQGVWGLGLRGDRTKRFTVSFDHDTTIVANQESTLSFRINDASSGNPVSLFEKVYEKPMHLIIVDSTLSHFSHVHPTQTTEGFSITTQFPKDGLYHLYIDFQPYGAIEQQFAFTIPVGELQTTPATFSSDTKPTKTFGQYEVTLQAPTPLSSEKLSIGEQEISFTIRSAKTKQAIKTLKPYLAAFGHLVMINEKTYDYLHVHPTNLTIPKPNENGGPTVTFLPLGLYGPIKPGIYRVFAQFNPNNKLFTADFTIEIK